MRERTQLSESIEACKALENGAIDNAELIELGEAEGDDEIIEENKE